MKPVTNPAPSNPPIPTFLRLVTWIECLVVFLAAFGLFFFPTLEHDFWAWSIPAFNSRFVGAIYFAALVPLLVFAILGRWSPWSFTFKRSSMAGSPPGFSDGFISSCLLIRLFICSSIAMQSRETPSQRLC
jgi:hypothetical protein